jgi:hypothetical protein
MKSSKRIKLHNIRWKAPGLWAFTGARLSRSRGGPIVDVIRLFIRGVHQWHSRGIVIAHAFPVCLKRKMIFDKDAEELLRIALSVNILPEPAFP